MKSIKNGTLQRHNKHSLDFRAIGKPIEKSNLPSKKLYHFSMGATIGGFPIEIKTKIRYLIICCYHNFIR